jgi:hypothetical protein
MIEVPKPPFCQTDVVRSDYYTPELSEFYLGFEFEVLNTKGKMYIPNYDEGVWVITKVDLGVLGDLSNLQKLILEKQIRVRVLNEHDIYELGFELKYEEENNPNKMYFLGKHSLIRNNHNRCIITVRSDERQEDCTGYAGVIKNKSELKRILQQLGCVQR